MARSALLNARSALLNAQDEEQLLTWLGHAQGHRLRPVFDTGTHVRLQWSAVPQPVRQHRPHYQRHAVQQRAVVQRLQSWHLGRKWIRTGRYKRCFFFRFRAAGNWAPLQCSYARIPATQLHCKNRLGPTWGTGHNLCFWHTENVANGNSAVRQSYNVLNDGSAAHDLAGQNNGWQSFAPRREVLVIEEAAPNHLLSHPGEQVDWSAEVCAQERKSTRALCGTGTGSFTKQLRKYMFEYSGLELNFALWYRGRSRKCEKTLFSRCS